MAEFGTPPDIPSLEPKVEIVQPAQEIKSNLPEHIQTQVDGIMQESKERKEKELKIQVVFQVLENKYPNFERSNFKIEISGLKKSEVDFLGYGIFLLYSKDGKLLSYIKDDGEILLYMTTFNPYMDSFEENMMKHLGIEIGIGNDGKWFLNDEYGITKEGEEEFDRYIISKYVLKK